MIHDLIIPPTDRHAALLANLYAMLLLLDGDEPEADAAMLHANSVAAFHEERAIETSGMAAATFSLVMLAETVGAVVTIDQAPLLPLAMGHYEHRVHVREKRAAA